MNLLDGITVLAYGSPMPLNLVVTLHVPEASLIRLQPYDASQFGARSASSSSIAWPGSEGQRCA